MVRFPAKSMFSLIFLTQLIDRHNFGFLPEETLTAGERQKFASTLDLITMSASSRATDLLRDVNEALLAKVAREICRQGYKGPPSSPVLVSHYRAWTDG